jgi:hypothetical protein
MHGVEVVLTTNACVTAAYLSKLIFIEMSLFIASCYNCVVTLPACPYKQGSAVLVWVFEGVVHSLAILVGRR